MIFVLYGQSSFCQLLDLLATYTPLGMRPFTAITAELNGIGGLGPVGQMEYKANGAKDAGLTRMIVATNQSDVPAEFLQDNAPCPVKRASNLLEALPLCVADRQEGGKSRLSTLYTHTHSSHALRPYTMNKTRNSDTA